MSALGVKVSNIQVLPYVAVEMLTGIHHPDYQTACLAHDTCQYLLMQCVVPIGVVSISLDRLTCRASCSIAMILVAFMQI